MHCETDELGEGPWLHVHPGQGDRRETTSLCSIPDTPEHEQALTLSQVHVNPVGDRRGREQALSHPSPKWSPSE